MGAIAFVSVMLSDNELLPHFSDTKWDGFYEFVNTVERFIYEGRF